MTYLCRKCGRTSYPNGGRPICVYCKAHAPLKHQLAALALVVLCVALFVAESLGR